MFRFVAAFALLTRLAPAQAPEIGLGWLQEFNLAARQLTALAEATPAEKFSWRPAPGVRSISEVYMHIATGNYLLLKHAGAPSAEMSSLPTDPEKSVTAKAEVITWMKKSFDAVRRSYATADMKKKVEFFGKTTVAESMFLRLLIHNHEHMGQSIAYARMNGVVPPWSAAQ